MHRIVFLTLSFKSLLLGFVKQKRTSKHLSVLFGGETGICLIAERVSLLTKAERQPGEPGFTPQAARCTASCKITVSEHNKNPT